MGKKKKKKKYIYIFIAEPQDDPLFTLFLRPFWWLKNGSGENVGLQNCFTENIETIRVVLHLSKAALWLASSPEQ